MLNSVEITFLDKHLTDIFFFLFFECNQKSKLWMKRENRNSSEKENAWMSACVCVCVCECVWLLSLRTIPDKHMNVERNWWNFFLLLLRNYSQIEMVIGIRPFLSVDFQTQTQFFFSCCSLLFTKTLRFSQNQALPIQNLKVIFEKKENPFQWIILSFLPYLLWAYSKIGIDAYLIKTQNNHKKSRNVPIKRRIRTT